MINSKRSKFGSHVEQTSCKWVVAVVVPDPNCHTRLFDEEGRNIDKALPTCHVQQTFSKTITALERAATLMKFMRFLDIL